MFGAHFKLLLGVCKDTFGVWIMMYATKRHCRKDKCRVCTAPAGYNYFGAISCESCRCFFRDIQMRVGVVERDVSLHELSWIFPCDGNCPVTPEDRKCKACRMKKCIEAGMSLAKSKRAQQTGIPSIKGAPIMKTTEKEKTPSRGTKQSYSTLNRSKKTHTGVTSKLSTDVCESGKSVTGLSPSERVKDEKSLTISRESEDDYKLRVPCFVVLDRLGPDHLLELQQGLPNFEPNMRQTQVDSNDKHEPMMPPNVRYDQGDMIGGGNNMKLNNSTHIRSSNMGGKNMKLNQKMRPNNMMPSQSMATYKGNHPGLMPNQNCGDSMIDYDPFADTLPPYQRPGNEQQRSPYSSSTKQQCSSDMPSLLGHFDSPIGNMSGYPMNRIAQVRSTSDDAFMQDLQDSSGFLGFKNQNSMCPNQQVPNNVGIPQFSGQTQLNVSMGPGSAFPQKSQVQMPNQQGPPKPQPRQDQPQKHTCERSEISQHNRQPAWPPPPGMFTPQRYSTNSNRSVGSSQGVRPPSQSRSPSEPSSNSSQEPVPSQQDHMYPSIYNNEPRSSQDQRNQQMQQTSSSSFANQINQAPPVNSYGCPESENSNYNSYEDHMPPVSNYDNQMITTCNYGNQKNQGNYCLNQPGDGARSYQQGSQEVYGGHMGQLSCAYDPIQKPPLPQQCGEMLQPYTPQKESNDTGWGDGYGMNSAQFLSEDTERCFITPTKAKDLPSLGMAYIAQYGGDSDSEGEGASANIVHVGDNFYLPRDLYAKLYGHQREGVLWMWKLHQDKKGGILADDMGLGKTIQVISFLSGLFEAEVIRTVLIVLPVAVIVNWEKEFQKWAPGIEVLTFHGNTKVQRERSLAKIYRLGGVVLTSYRLLVTSVAALCEKDGEEIAWDYIILDEGHKIKNPSTKVSKCIHSIGAKQRLILTGTPVQNNLKEMWALFDWTHQGTLLGTQKTFHMQYAEPIYRARQKDATAGEQQLGLQMALSLQKIITPYFLRRTKCALKKDESWHKTLAGKFDTDDSEHKASVMPTFTRKNDLICWVFLSEIQQKIYKAYVQTEEVKDLLNSVITPSPVHALMILKKICDHARLLNMRQCVDFGIDVGDQLIDIYNMDEATAKECAANRIWNVSDEMLTSESGKMSFLIKLLDNLRLNGHRTLVFSKSKKVLNIIQKVLTNKEHKVLRLDGDVKTPAEREEIIERFSRDETYTVFLLTTQVGGVGLTLTAADRVVIYDPSWNPATDAQAVDRVFRIGQMKNVIIYRLITCGSIEEKIYRRQIFKESITRQTMGDNNNPYRYFSHHELHDLFVLDNPRYSSTQVHLQRLHSNNQRKTDTKLNEHIAFLQSLDMFGISNHDLMFSQEANDDEDFEQHTDFINHRVSQAQRAIALESEENNQVTQQLGCYPSSIEIQPKRIKPFHGHDIQVGHKQVLPTNSSEHAHPLAEYKENQESTERPSKRCSVCITPIGNKTLTVKEFSTCMNCMLTPPMNVVCEEIMFSLKAHEPIISLSSSSRARTPEFVTEDFSQKDQMNSTILPGAIPSLNVSLENETVLVEESDQDFEDDDANEEKNLVASLENAQHACSAIQRCPEEEESDTRNISVLGQQTNDVNEQLLDTNKDSLEKRNSDDDSDDEKAHHQYAFGTIPKQAEDEGETGGRRCSIL